MTGARQAITATSRLGVPAMFSEGRFEQVLILTFGADLEFYEPVLRRHFGHYRNQIVLADARQLRDSIGGIAANTSLRHLNRSWLAGPIQCRRSAHAKAILLAAPDRGLLLVGSGNLNIAGYAGPGECFTPFRWTPEASEDLPAFTAVKELTERLGATGQLDAVTQERLGVFWNAYNWWHAPPEQGLLRHNLDVPLAEQFIAALEGERVEELTVVAPFYDKRCAALDRLATRLSPRRLRVLVQRGRCSVDPTALQRVLDARGGRAHTISAAGDYSDAYLHAKIFLAKTRRRAVCLTGSANCSMVALWRPPPDANVELGSLAVGSVMAFDHLLDPAVVTISRPVAPASLDLRVREDPDEAPPEPLVELVDLRWKAPTLTAVLSVEVTDPGQIGVELDGRPIPVTIHLVQTGDGATTVSCELLEAADIESLDQVAVVVVTVRGQSAAVGVAYQLERLQEQDRRRVDVERLRQAAQLELEDPELEKALAALEEILVGENVVQWTHNRVTSGDDDVGEGASVAWEDIDWAAVRRHPRAAAYGGPAGFGTPGSDLAAYLDALSRAVRVMVEPEPIPPEPIPPDPPKGTERPEDDEDDDDEPGIAGGVENPDIDGVVDGPDDGRPRRKQSIAARNRRLIRNFVRRNLRALEQPAFREGAGPGIVVPNVVILNWVCWWVATTDEDSPGGLVDERLRLWRLIWGDAAAGDAGYLASLEDDHKLLVLERFEEQHFQPVTIASIIDVWAHIPSEADPEYRLLRNILRNAVTNPCWHAGADEALGAAKLINSRPTTLETFDGPSVAGALWSAACKTVDDGDTRLAVAKAANVEVNRILVSDESVVVDQTRRRLLVRQITIPAGDLSNTAIRAVFAAWQATDERDHYRLKWDGGVALYRRIEQTGWIHRGSDDSITDFGAIAPALPPWRTELDLLCDAAERATEAA